MRLREQGIRSAGLSLLYEPDGAIEACADVVLVHGIGGHPLHSFKQSRRRKDSTAKPPATAPEPSRPEPDPWCTARRFGSLRKSASESLLGQKYDSTGRPRNVLRKCPPKSLSSSSAQLLRLIGDTPEAEVDAAVYWPLDLLPLSCPHTRIFTWGWKVDVVDEKLVLPQASLGDHAKAMLAELTRARGVSWGSQRPLVFVAHSTGGILVKELLRLSELDDDGPSKGIIQSTAAVLFLGCPHRRGAQNSLAKAVQIMASVTLDLKQDDGVLREWTESISGELELGRQAFIKLWNKYNFAVKTAHESLDVYGTSVDDRAKAIIRRQCSLLDDDREETESLQAKHAELCRFSSVRERGYRILVGLIVKQVDSVMSKRDGLGSRERECLAALIGEDESKHQIPETSSFPETCLWLYDIAQFRSWHQRSDSNRHRILWIHGPSGCGKTSLLSSLSARLEQKWRPTSAAFVRVKASHDSNSADGLAGQSEDHGAHIAAVCRSLMVQLFPQDPRLRTALLDLYQNEPNDPLIFGDMRAVSFFLNKYLDRKVETCARRTFVFVDVADGASTNYISDLMVLLSHLAVLSDFSICVASDYRDLDVKTDAFEVPMQLLNTEDILRYVDINLVVEWEERNDIIVQIGQKAGGVFLWASIVLNILNAAILEGATCELIQDTLEELPSDLHGLYEWMLLTLDQREKGEALILFQWIILAGEPLRLNDLLVAVRLTERSSMCEVKTHIGVTTGTPESIRELRRLRNSQMLSETPEQFHRWIRSRSIGLVHVKARSQGRLREPLGLQRAYPVHESVRTFFRSGRGFACLAGHTSQRTKTKREDLIDEAHCSLLQACLRYLNMREFEMLSRGSLQDNPHRHAYAASHSWRRSTDEQRHLVMSSYPFLQYAVQHLLYHMLSPRQVRYFLPQHDIMGVFAAHRGRLWRRWTALLGMADPGEILALHRTGAAAGLLSPVFGAVFRLERVFRKLSRLTGGEVAIAVPRTARECSRLEMARRRRPEQEEICVYHSVQV